ncbi:hypothetical protein [Sporomusa ovata]|nr:hypothetical protein [Sporomusa ovata]
MVIHKGNILEEKPFWHHPCQLEIWSILDIPLVKHTAMRLGKTASCRACFGIHTNTKSCFLHEAMLYVKAKQYETMPAITSEYYFEIIRQGYRDNGIDIEPIVVALSEAKAEILI